MRKFLVFPLWVLVVLCAIGCFADSSNTEPILEYENPAIAKVSEQIQFNPNDAELYLTRASLFSESQLYENANTISIQLAVDRFDYSYYSYQRAGAFVKYLINLYGIEKVKQYYTTTISHPYYLRESDFNSIFGIKIVTSHLFGVASSWI